MKRTLFLLAIILLAQISFSQNKTIQYNHIFSSDSLAGFDEEAAKRSAISEGFLGEEFKVRMWGLKRNYINSKYNLVTKSNAYKGANYNNTRPVAAVCVNEDFEGSSAGVITTVNQINGWTLSSGTNNFNTCNITTTNTTSESELVNCTTSGFIDPNIGGVYPIYSVFGTTPNSGPSANPSIPNMYGTNVIRINNNVNDYSIERLSKTILVTANNNLFQFAFIGVFSTGHTCCDAGAFMITLTNATTNMPITCPSFSCAGNTPSCPTGTDAPSYYNALSGTPYTGTGSIIFNKWQINSIDLSAYIGQNITIDITATDCDAGGHYGYCYFDSQCSSATMTINNSSFSSANPVVNFPTCGASNFIITAPAGQGPYMWSGPNVPSPYNTLLMSNQTFPTNMAGTYTLTMYPIGNCGPVTKTININFMPSPPPLSITGNTLICGSLGASLTVSGANTYTWSTGSNASNVVFTPTVTTNYSVASTDANGCYNSASVAVNYSPVNLSISGSNIVCVGSSATFTLNGGTSYSLNSVNCANTVNMLPMISTVYTVTAANAAGCNDTQTLNVYVNTGCADVWPGDANSDGMANNLDILELGLHLTQTGAARATSANLWQSYFANNWIGLISNGQNVNHSDCNGDGIIDQNDTLAIYNNYNLTHAFKNAVTVANPQLNITPDQNFVQSGQWGSASIYLGDSANQISNVNGIAFTLNFDNSFIQQDSIYLEYPASFLNAGNHNLHFRKKHFVNGLIYTATTHTNNIAVNGNGKVAIFHFKVSPALNFDTLFNFNLLNANLSNANGVIFPLSVNATNTVVIGNTAPVGIKENLNNNNNILIFPNPANGLITIKNTKEIQKMEVMNVAGQILMCEPGKSKTQQLMLDYFAEGIYFVKIYNSDNSIAWKKVVVKH